MNSFSSAKGARGKESGAALFGLEYYEVADYRRLFLRRKWMIITTALMAAVVVGLGALRLPNLYQSSTEIVVDPGKVPESYVKSTATIDAVQRLALLQAEILSTTRLGQVIDETGLYQRLKTRMTREDIVARMRKDIKVEPVTVGTSNKELEAFKVSFTSRSALLAATVSNRLASLFIEENMRVREQQVLGTADFFERELEKAKHDLADKGEKLAGVRARHVSALPNSQNVELQALTAAQMELRSEIDAESRASEQTHSLSAMLADNPTVVNLDTTHPIEDIGMEDELQRLQGEMDQLHSRYGPNYPDVLAKAAEIEKVKEQIQDAEKAKPQMSAPPSNGRRHNPVIESQLAALDQEVLKHHQRQQELKTQISYYKSQLQGAPEAEQELTAANDDYSNAEERYKRLEERKFSADMSSEVEARQKGERFVIVEPAQPPEHPDSPNRLLIDIGGLGAGLVLAIFLALALEIINPSVKTTREISDRLKVPVIGEVPWLVNSSSRIKLRLRGAFAAGASVVLALGYADLLRVALQ